MEGLFSSGEISIEGRALSVRHRRSALDCRSLLEAGIARSRAAKADAAVNVDLNVVVVVVDVVVAGCSCYEYSG